MTSSMDQKVFQTSPSGRYMSQIPTRTMTSPTSFDRTRISTASIVILPVTSPIPVSHAPPGVMRFAPQGTFLNPPPLVATAPTVHSNPVHPSTVTHLMVRPHQRLTDGAISDGGPVSIFMGTPGRPQGFYTPISQRQQLIQSSMDNNYRAVMEPINIKQEPSTEYGLHGSSSQFSNSDERNEGQHVLIGHHQLHDSIDDEEPEAEPPSNDIMPVNMTQPKNGSLSQISTIQIKPEGINIFEESFNQSNSTEDCSLIPSQSLVGRNKSEVVSSRTILGWF